MPIVQTLITVLLSGAITAMVIFALNERRDRTSMLLQKAEAAAEAYTEWYDLLREHPTAHFDLFYAEEVRREKARNDIAQAIREIGIKSAKAQMLIHIYLPNEVLAIANLLSSFKPMISYSGELRTASLKGVQLPPRRRRTARCDRSIGY